MLTKPLIGLLAAFLCSGLPAWSQNQLPDGNEKETVANACIACHELKTVTSAGHTKEDWTTVLRMMVNIGAPVPADRFDAVRDYLAKALPEKPKPPAVAIPGSVEVSIKEWTVPTPGSRPHDPMVARDGYIWYTGQMANVLGRFDPRTEQFKEFPLKTPISGPHGLVEDKDGNIWFAAIFKGYIGKFNPKTGDITEYPTHDPDARDPHTPIFDQKGILFFTMQSSNMVGRINPKTGEVKVVHVPTPKSNPYGMVVTSKGIPYFVEWMANKVTSINPETMELHEYTLPNEGTRPRRVAITPDDVLYYSDYFRGYLGRFDTKTGKTAEWPSPGGPDSRPYAIAYVNGVVWYVESNTKPNEVVRFDPKTEKFQTWPIPSGGGVVRNMMKTPDGNMWLACSGVNKIAFVEVKGNSRMGQGN
jgi:virginiamycin B lyase